MSCQRELQGKKKNATVNKLPLFCPPQALSAQAREGGGGSIELNEKATTTQNTGIFFCNIRIITLLGILCYGTLIIIRFHLGAFGTDPEVNCVAELAARLDGGQQDVAVALVEFPIGLW